MAAMNHFSSALDKPMGPNFYTNDSLTETQLRQENSELRQRVADLEYKVLTQMEELSSMKDAMNEWLRRMNNDTSSLTINTPVRPMNRANVSFRRPGSSLGSPMAMSATLTSSNAATFNNLASPRSMTLNSTSGISITSSHLRGGGGAFNTLSPLPPLTRNSPARSSISSDHGRLRLNGILSNSASPITLDSGATSQPGGPYMIGKKVVPAWRPAGGSIGGGTSPTTNTSSPLMASRRRSRSSSALKRATVEPQNGIRDAVFIKNDGLVRASINGRGANLYVPSTVSNYDVKGITELPSHQLRLEWIYGYRGRDCRNNVYYLPTGEVAYFVATVVVLYNPDENIQRHYTGHTEDVRCITVHPDHITVASGQSAGRVRSEKKAHIRVWNSVNLTTLHVLGVDNFQLAVTCLAFSRSDGGELLGAVDESQEHNISLWDWQKEQKITETVCSSEPVLAVDFHPVDRGQLVTCGKNHLSFWTLDALQLCKKQANFEKYDRPKAVLCIAYAENGDLLTGDTSGNICIWRRGSNKLHYVIQRAHEGPIAALTINRDGHLVSGGGRDGRLLWWDSAFQPTGHEVLLKESWGAVRSLSGEPQSGNVLLVGTSRNHILQGNFLTGLQVVVSGGHWDDLWCLAAPSSWPLNSASGVKFSTNMKPSMSTFFTGSYDGHVTLWDSLTRQPIWSRELSSDSPPHCATYHPSGQMVTVGTKNGRWIVMDVMTQELVAVHTDGTEQIECIQYSLDGAQIAIASRDGTIYVYTCLDNGRKYSRVGKCTGHTNSVTKLDWSENGRYIRSCSIDYELLYWTANNCRQVVACSQLRDTEWISHNCVLGFHVMGLWTPPSDNSAIGERSSHRVSEAHVNACARSNSASLLASAEGNTAKGGALKLMRYPASHPKTFCHTYKLHSGEVTGVTFLSDDSRVISVGGRDCSIMQWQVVQP